MAFAPAASDVRFSECVKRPSALALKRRLRCDPSHAGVMPYGPAESWLPRLSATPYRPARRLRRLESLALCCDDVKAFSPERGLCQIKFFRWSQRPMRQNEARPAWTARSASSSWARGKPKYASTVAHELGDETVIARDRERPFIFQTDFDRRVTSRRARRKTPGSRDDGQAQVTSTEKSMILNGASRGVRPALLTQSLRARRRVASYRLWDNFRRQTAICSATARSSSPTSLRPTSHSSANRADGEDAPASLASSNSTATPSSPISCRRSPTATRRAPSASTTDARPATASVHEIATPRSEDDAAKGSSNCEGERPSASMTPDDGTQRRPEARRVRRLAHRQQVRRNLGHFRDARRAQVRGLSDFAFAARPIAKAYEHFAKKEEILYGRGHDQRICTAVAKRRRATARSARRLSAPSPANGETTRRTGPGGMSKRR